VSAHLRRIGSEAEDRAADYLLTKGYTVVARRVKMRSGEIDIVALDGEVLVLVEVKCRRTDFQTPEEAVDRRKATRFDKAAGEYVLAAGTGDRVVRYDLIAIDNEGLRHHADAFAGGSCSVDAVQEDEEEWTPG
jgi:putative endonuclease